MNAEPVKSTSTSLTEMLTAGTDHLSTRVRKVLGWYVVGATAAKMSQEAVRRAQHEMSFTIAVDGADDLYPDCQQWLLDRVPKSHQRSLLVRSHRPEPTVAVGGGVDVNDVRSLRLFYDGRRTQTVWVEGHRVRISVETEDLSGARDRDGNRSTWGWKRDRILFRARGVGGRDAVLRVLREMAEARNERRRVRCFVGTSWGEWRRGSDMPARPLESVVLRDGLADELVTDLGQFLGQEERYAALGIPWHRGYLFEGPPGTGKTSLAKALAERHWLDVYYIPLASVPNDGVLLTLLANLPARSMLLLEDIDIVHASREREDKEPGVSMSGLLNGLDGVLTPHGLVTVITTNRIEVIDAALLREGRVDRTLRLDVLDDAQLHRLVAHALSRPCPPLPPVARDLVPAQVLEAIKPYLDDPDAAITAVARLIGEPVLRAARS